MNKQQRLDEFRQITRDTNIRDVLNMVEMYCTDFPDDCYSDLIKAPGDINKINQAIAIHNNMHKYGRSVEDLIYHICGEDIERELKFKLRFIADNAIYEHGKARNVTFSEPDITCIVAGKDKIFYGTSKGELFEFDEKNKDKPFVCMDYFDKKMHPVTALCCLDDYIYSGHQDGTLRKWDKDGNMVSSERKADKPIIHIKSKGSNICFATPDAILLEDTVLKIGQHDRVKKIFTEKDEIIIVTATKYIKDQFPENVTGTIYFLDKNCEVYKVWNIPYLIDAELIGDQIAFAHGTNIPFKGRNFDMANKELSNKEINDFIKTTKKVSKDYTETLRLNNAVMLEDKIYPYVVKSVHGFSICGNPCAAALWTHPIKLDSELFVYDISYLSTPLIKKSISFRLHKDVKKLIFI